MVFMLVFVLFFVACPTEDEILIETKAWESKDGFIQFYTNDSKNYGKIFWTAYENVNAANTYEIECKKMSGSEDWHYGMIFDVSLDLYTYHRIAITSDGYYSVYSQNGKDDEGTMQKSWIRSDKLNTGYDTLNSIKVTKSGTTYTVFLNDAQVFEFTSSITGGNRIGYFAIVGSEEDEDFPNNPVDVRFRQK
jgi:hypothetical protein